MSRFLFLPLSLSLNFLLDSTLAFSSPRDLPSHEEKKISLSPTFLGKFVEHQHEVSNSKCVKKKKKATIQVSGRLGVANPHKIVLTQFNYDGLGPAAFFLAGKYFQIEI